MTKVELFKEYQNLLEQKGMRKIDDINFNCNKSTIEFAINCLKCSDEQLDEYLIIVKEKYPNAYKVIADGNSNGCDYKYHSYRRWFVYHCGVC